jgi:hypothetical protein
MSRRMTLKGYVAQMRRNAYKILMRRPEVKKALGRPRYR